LPVIGRRRFGRIFYFPAFLNIEAATAQTGQPLFSIVVIQCCPAVFAFICKCQLLFWKYLFEWFVQHITEAASPVIPAERAFKMIFDRMR
jgi:hypothetical protein